jgi:sn-glycerol 3-phosphate transport system substrate-binding protein
MWKGYRKWWLVGILALGSASAQKTSITFYYPVGVAGPLARFIEAYVADFTKRNPFVCYLIAPPRPS